LRLYFLTINSFVGFPVMRFIVNAFQSNNPVIYHCQIDSFTNYFQNKGQEIVIQTYKDSQAYNSKSFAQKILRYLYFIKFVRDLSIRLEKESQPACLYTIDIFAYWMALLIKKKLGGQKVVVVYHQFEIIESTTLSKLDAYFLKRIRKHSQLTDLVVAPEQNRLNILKETFHISENTKVYTFPNSNNIVAGVNKKIVREQAKIVIGHIGAVGIDHFVKEFFEALYLLPRERFKLLMVGNIIPAVRDLVESYQGKFDIELISEVPHARLDEIYKQIDIGVILYKAVNINFEYCAPNKLYEYWAYGIPVVGHTLPGLLPLFTSQHWGKLVNMENSKGFAEGLLDLSSKLGKELSNELVTLFQQHHNLDLHLKNLNNLIITSADE
jgi:glycosyltransferase involved in cell wall biosynthesis